MKVACCNYCCESSVQSEPPKVKENSSCVIADYCKSFFSGFTCISSEQRRVKSAEIDNEEITPAPELNDNAGYCNNNTYTCCGKTERVVVIVAKEVIITGQPKPQTHSTYPQTTLILRNGHKDKT